MNDWEYFNRSINRRGKVLGADRLRIGDLLETEELDSNTRARLSELQRDIDVTMTGGWG